MGDFIVHVAPRIFALSGFAGASAFWHIQSENVRR
jgi:hypothetical protein